MGELSTGPPDPQSAQERDRGVFDVLLKEAVPEEFYLPDVDLLVPHPTGVQLAAFDQAPDSRGALRALTGPAFEAAWRLCRKEPIGVLAALVRDIRHHYGLLEQPVGGWAGLVATLDRYGEAIEQDLHDRGDRLVLYFMRHEGRTWRQLMVVLRGLPSDSHFIAAQKNDPEVADFVVARGDADGDKWTPQATEFGVVEELLAAIFDRVGDLLAATINQNAKAPVQPPTRFPRPVTEVDKARARIESVIETELADLITGAHTTWEAEHN